MSVLEESALPVVQLSNIQVFYENPKTVGGIYWVPINTSVVLTADIPLPDSVFMIMVEERVNANTAVGGIRRPAEIKNGRLTLAVPFKRSGYFAIDSARLNLGLIDIKAGFQLSSFLIEFDVFDEV